MKIDEYCSNSENSGEDCEVSLMDCVMCLEEECYGEDDIYVYGENLISKIIEENVVCCCWVFMVR